MAQNHYYNGSGRSRAKGNSRNRKRQLKRGGSGYDIKKLIIGILLLVAAIACIVFLLKDITSSSSKSETETETETETEIELLKQVSVEGVDITGLSMETAKEAIRKRYPWSMQVTWNGDSYEVADLLSQWLDVLLSEIYQGDPDESYDLDMSGLDELVAAEAANAAARWDLAAKNGSISSYDASSDTFLFSGAEEGRAVDQEQLISDISDALEKKDFDAVIAASVNVIEPEFSEEAARAKYKTISTFTTSTTANSKRNTNVRLAAEAVNGTILQPGEEFSFNGTVGERTEAKGYQGAAAYNNGEVVEEIGGGVCQVSSTLYNAVVQAGLRTTVRRSHTFEPSYVTPGTDATVSWESPDYKFVNNSSTAIGIRAKYSDRKMTVSIYGIPILEDGVTYSLSSTKLKDTDIPAATYEEDQTLQPDVEVIKSAGSMGSQWETRLVIKKDGTVISEEVDHTVTYKGHAPVILRNTSGIVIETQETDENGELIESSTDATAESAEGLDPETEETTTAATGGVSAAPGSTGSASSSAAASPGMGPGAATTADTPTTVASSVSGAPTAASSSGTSDGPTASTVPIVAPNPGG